MCTLSLFSNCRGCLFSSFFLGWESNNNKPIDIREGLSALSMVAIVVREGDKILISNDQVTIYIEGNRSSTRNDTIIIALRQRIDYLQYNHKSFIR